MLQRLAIALMTATLAWGCKDDSDASRTGDSGAHSGRADLAGDRALGKLTESETVSLCEQLRDTTNSAGAQRGTCVIAASAAVDFANSGRGTPAEVQKECEDQLATCLAKEPEPCQPIRFTANCKATIDDFTECSNIASQQLSELADRSCDDIIEQSGADAGVDGGASDGGVGITSGLEDELARCSNMLKACTPGT